MTTKICAICSQPATHREQFGFPDPHERLLCQWHASQTKRLGMHNPDARRGNIYRLPDEFEIQEEAPE